MLLAALFACAPPEGVAPGTSPSPGWTVGEGVACEDAGPPTWTADPTPAETYEAVDLRGHEPGAVGIVEVRNEAWLVWATPRGAVRARPLLGGDAVDVDPRLAMGFAQADLDGDGAMDLLLAREEVTLFWGFGTRMEREDHLAVEEGETVRDVAATDLDGDGLLDLVLAFTTTDHSDLEALRGEVRRNLGDRQFGPAEPIPGGADVWGPAFDLTVFDHDGDAVPDVYLCNDFGLVANAVLGNSGGALSPTDARGLDVKTSCMGTAWGDVGADGALDALIVSAPSSYLLEASPDGYYDTAAARGLSPIDLPDMAWGGAVVDLDNDGRSDVVYGVSEFYGAGMAPFPMPWYRQAEDGTFVEEGAAAGFPQEARTRGVVARELNGDGVLDLVVGDALRSPWVLWSDGCSEGAWLTIDAPYGSEVVVRAGDRAWAAQVTTDAGWASTGPAQAHIGLGDLEEVDAIEIRPPWLPTVVLEGPIATRRVVTWTPGD